MCVPRITQKKEDRSTWGFWLLVDCLAHFSRPYTIGITWLTCGLMTSWMSHKRGFCRSYDIKGSSITWYLRVVMRMVDYYDIPNNRK